MMTKYAVSALLCIFSLTTPLLAQTETINFEQFTGPSVFTGVQPPLTVGIATFSGGQILNAATFLPADRSVVYGTASNGGSLGATCPGCLPTITIDFSEPVSDFSIFVINGNTVTVTYTVRDNQGGSQTLSLVANFQSGAGTVVLPEAGITQVTITGSTTDQWDFFIDNVSFQVCKVTSVMVQTNPACDSSLSPLACSANIVRADGEEMTAIKTSLQPARAMSVDESADFGSPDSPVLTKPDGTAISNYTAGSLAFGFPDTSTTVANLSAKACGQPFPHLAQIFNYNAFNFHQSQVSDAEFVDSTALTASGIEGFFKSVNAGKGSFLAHFILVGEIGGFYDTNGNGVHDPGEPVYQAGVAPIPVHARGISAAALFAREAVGQGVNPKVLLATVEKEERLISFSSANLPSAYTLNKAMGCDLNVTSKRNFVAQIHCAAVAFINNFNQTPSEPFFWPSSGSLPGIRHPEAIKHDVTGMGLRPVGFQVDTAATFAQYRYTPFIQSLPDGGGVYLFEKLWKQYGF